MLYVKKDVNMRNLGLIIQRKRQSLMSSKSISRNKGLEVNYLKMSATPIPKVWHFLLWYTDLCDY